MPFDILLVTIARALVEVAGTLLLGRGVLWMFGPKGREGNFIYDLFKMGTQPIITATRVITPRFIHDAHVGLVSFFILGCLWLGLAIAKYNMCITRGLQCA